MRDRDRPTCKACGREFDALLPSTLHCRHRLCIAARGLARHRKWKAKRDEGVTLAERRALLGDPWALASISNAL